MTPELIIEFARQCGLSEDAGSFGGPPGPSSFWTDGDRGVEIKDLLRFASLVAAHEREECAKVCEAEHLEDPQDREDDAYDCAVADCAAAIRARKEKT